ncbi:hypothetical protein BCR35DRAFT_300929 [Leucosporidium creatinivorum]|uniref:Uncharacterized protein n=1 Tax=Leucosporidium creatinivorum TaxID=106004 RepID=A0A1Y2FYH1_9BASI|nr:hypothetical protein BCR35DRAFT_300929 [Leucosporidium creatinivorum]
MLGQAIALLGTLALASAAPSALGSPAAATATPFACTLRSWVRAPDLTPGLLSTADARLLANGSDCQDLVGWSVGLRFKERAIVRLPAEGVELPAKPEFNQTAMAEWFAKQGQSDIYRVGWHEEQKSPYELEREAYELAMRNTSLWEVHGAERQVFDQQVQLAVAKGEASIPLRAVKSFAIAVPNVNLPPFLKDDFSQRSLSDEEGFAASEFHFDYYFTLALRNGSNIEVPAGRSAFVPLSAPAVESTRTERVTILMDQKADEKERFMLFEEARVENGECTADNTTTFAINIEVPSGEHVFEAGKELFLPTNIRRVKGSAQGPTFISFKANTIPAETWCSSFGHSDVERKTIALGDSSAYENASPWDQDAVQKIKMAGPAKTSQEEKEAAQQESATGSSDYYWSNEFEYRQAGGTKLNPLLEEQTVLVNFTTAHGLMPTFKTTFRSYLSFLQITLHTTQNCTDSTPELNEDKDIEDDNLWVSSYGALSPSKRAERSFKHLGNLSISITSPLTTTSPLPVHYTSPQALSPVLLPSLPSSAEEISFPLLNSTIRAEEGMDELKQSRYRDGWLWTNEDGRYQHVGKVWARKVQWEKEREEGRRKAERERSGFVVQVKESA